MATMTGFLAQDPCFQSVLMGDIDDILSRFDDALVAERQDASSTPSLHHDVEISIGLRYKSSEDETRQTMNLGLIYSRNCFIKAWGSSALMTVSFMTEVSLKFKNSTELTFATIQRQEHHKGS